MLAEQVPSIPNAILIVAVALGVGVFLMAAMLSDAFFQNLTVFIDLVLSVCFSPGLLRAR